MFPPATYRSRRRTLVEHERPDSGLVLLLGNRRSPRNYVDNPHPFRQDGTFLYYFGLDRPDLYGLIDLDAGASTLYGEEATLDDVVWEGEQTALREDAAAVGIDTVDPPSALDARIAQARQQGRPVHVLPPYRDEHRLRLETLLGRPHTQLDDAVSEPLIRAVVRQRSVKSSEEVAEIETALERTAQAHACAQERAIPGASEQEIVGAMTGLLTTEGSTFSFTPTCSVRGEVLHNHSYPNTLEEGDLLLVDAGATSPCHYAGDVTRVTPVGGGFTPQQRAIYDAVLSAQTAAINAVAPDVPFIEIHKHAARTLTEHLIDLGLMQGAADEAVALPARPGAHDGPRRPRHGKPGGDVCGVRRGPDAAGPVRPPHLAPGASPPARICNHRGAGVLLHPAAHQAVAGRGGSSTTSGWRTSSDSVGSALRTTCW